MNRIVVILIFILFHVTGLCQGLRHELAVVIINKPIDADLYYGIKNELKVVVEGLNCNDFTVEYFGGDFIKNACKITLIPNDTTLSFTYIVIKSRNQIDTIHFVMEFLPKPLVFIHGFGWELHPPVLDSVCAFNSSASAGYQILGFELVFKSGSKILYKSNHTNSIFSMADKEAYLKLTKGDKVILNNVVIIGEDKRKLIVNEIVNVLY